MLQKVCGEENEQFYCFSYVYFKKYSVVRGVKGLYQQDRLSNNNKVILRCAPL
jgi:hypothetical protein